VTVPDSVSLSTAPPKRRRAASCQPELRPTPASPRHPKPAPSWDGDPPRRGMQHHLAGHPDRRTGLLGGGRVRAHPWVHVHPTHGSMPSPPMGPCPPPFSVGLGGSMAKCPHLTAQTQFPVSPEEEPRWLHPPGLPPAGTLLHPIPAASPPLTWPGETWSCRWGTSTGQRCRPPPRRSSPAAEGTRRARLGTPGLRRPAPTRHAGELSRFARLPVLPGSTDANKGNLVLARLWGKKIFKKPKNHTGQGFIFGIKRSGRREGNRNVTSVAVSIPCTRRRSQQLPPSQEGKAAAGVINELPDLTLITRLQSWEGRACFHFRGGKKKKNKQTHKTPQT